MHLFKKLLIGLAILISSCSGNNKSNSYLKFGETGSTGKLSYTITRVEYVDGYSSDENKKNIEIEFVIHSNSSNFIDFNGNYAISIDGSSYETFILYGTFPQSIAPNSDELVILKHECFPDWKTMTIKFYENINPTFAFSIRHSDYPNNANYYDYYYPTLGSGGSHDYPSDLSVKINSFVLTSTGSEYAGSGDNLSLQFTLANNTDQSLTFSSVYYSMSVKVDSGFKNGSISISTPTNPQSVSAHSEATFNLVIVADSTWGVIVLTHKINNYSNYSFILENKF